MWLTALYLVCQAPAIFRKLRWNGRLYFPNMVIYTHPHTHISTCMCLLKCDDNPLWNEVYVPSFLNLGWTFITALINMQIKVPCDFWVWVIKKQNDLRLAHSLNWDTCSWNPASMLQEITDYMKRSHVAIPPNSSGPPPTTLWVNETIDNFNLQYLSLPAKIHRNRKRNKIIIAVLSHQRLEWFVMQQKIIKIDLAGCLAFAISIYN